MKMNEYLAWLEQRKKEKPMQNTQLNSKSIHSRKKDSPIKTLNVPPPKKTTGVASNGSLLPQENARNIPILLNRRKRKALEEVTSNVISSPQKIQKIYPSKNIKIKSPLLNLSKTRALATKPPLAPKKSPTNNHPCVTRTLNYSTICTTTSTSLTTEQEKQITSSKKEVQDPDQNNLINLSEENRPSFSLRNEVQHWKQVERFADLM